MPALWLLATLLLALISPTAWCDEVAPTAAEPPVAVPPINPFAEVEERQRKLLIGLAGVAGITIAGIGLVALVIIWGGRLRRQNRAALPATSAQNEFWFLKSPKPPVSDREVGETESAE